MLLNMTRHPKASQDAPVIYRIRARGLLDESWSDSVGGMGIAIKQEAGTIATILTGELPDQTALSGVLNLLYDLGLTLLSVESLDDPTPVEGAVDIS